MSFINMALNDVKLDSEKQPVPESLYDLVIKRHIMNKQETGICCFIGISGHPEARDITYNINFPQASDDEEKASWKLKFAKAFLVLFNIDIADDGSWDSDDLESATAADVPVEISEYKGVARNEIAIMSYL